MFPWYCQDFFFIFIKPFPKLTKTIVSFVINNDSILAGLQPVAQVWAPTTPVWGPMTPVWGPMAPVWGPMAPILGPTAPRGRTHKQTQKKQRLHKYIFVWLEQRYVPSRTLLNIHCLFEISLTAGAWSTNYHSGSGAVAQLLSCVLGSVSEEI